MKNLTKEQQFNLPPAAVFNLQQIALADDGMVKAPGAAEKYRFIARHILELFEASGSVAAPTWYTENEMYDWLTRNNYHENIAKELSSKWAADLQGAFNKGFEKGTRELASLRQRLETLRGFVKEVDASLYHGPDLEDKEIMQHYIEVFKIIKEEAKKLLSEDNNKPSSREPVRL